ncbi:hypothetical protein ASG37_02115 [Sphingomonas sp. Leaf407]|uniref:hypothetical protein n=1 Tax=unclassified Sphingomonas TaxID=196159 RepID=UPI0006FC9344|nr:MULTISPECIES: hypothetical protein [unclassified Sphingomonas]KQN40604.1 hypothetical protein ASE97_02140 [Sphingomonas sp. Leaf42]KQT29960.1 hypothetical protein ASG37_02115 [Sphingomonas sp. Leaf407]
MARAEETLERAELTLERVRERHGAVAPRARRRREAEVLKRLGRIAAADGAIIVGALLIGWFMPLGLGGAMLVMALLIAATALFALMPVTREVVVEQLGQAPLKSLPAQTERWLSAQRPALPAPAMTLADAIGIKLDTLSAQLVGLNEGEPAAAEVRKLVGEQLPELVRGYQRVPEPLRRVARNGRTPDEQLVEGLKVIDGEIAAMTQQLAQGDLDSLATRERYLQIKYQGEE